MAHEDDAGREARRQVDHMKGALHGAPLSFTLASRSDYANLPSMTVAYYRLRGSVHQQWNDRVRSRCDGLAAIVDKRPRGLERKTFTWMNHQSWHPTSQQDVRQSVPDEGTVGALLYADQTRSRCRYRESAERPIVSHYGAIDAVRPSHLHAPRPVQRNPLAKLAGSD